MVSRLDCIVFRIEMGHGKWTNQPLLYTRMLSSKTSTNFHRSQISRTYCAQLDYTNVRLCVKVKFSGVYENVISTGMKRWMLNGLTGVLYHLFACCDCRAHEAQIYEYCSSDIQCIVEDHFVDSVQCQLTVNIRLTREHFTVQSIG